MLQLIMSLTEYRAKIKNILESEEPATVLAQEFSLEYRETAVIVNSKAFSACTHPKSKHA